MKFFVLTYHGEMKCPVTGKNCLKHKSFDSEGHLVCEDCLHKAPKPVQSVNDMTCGSCGISLAEIVKGSRIGCSSCYDNFSETMPHIVGSAQMGDSGMRHTGRTPKKFLEEMAKSTSHEEIREEITMRMMSASSQQNYSEAAKMKSKIEELDSLSAEKDGRADHKDRLAQFIIQFWEETSERLY